MQSIITPAYHKSLTLYIYYITIYILKKKNLFLLKKYNYALYDILYFENCTSCY